MLKIMENLNGKSLLLAVSGGLDSVCLLHFFKTNFEILGLKKIAVAHIDHALRNEESEKMLYSLKNYARNGMLIFISNLSKAF